MKTRQDALELLYLWVKSESLRWHCKSVAAAMEGYAEKFGEDKEKWFICGLLHDFDYEKYPDINIHPIKGCEELEKLGYDKDIIEAIMGHNEVTGVERKSEMAKTLFAVDELSGLIVALSKVRPQGFEGMSAKSVEKALKKKDFAAAISREDIEKGITGLNVDRKEHFDLVIKSLSSLGKNIN